MIYEFSFWFYVFDVNSILECLLCLGALEYIYLYKYYINLSIMRYYKPINIVYFYISIVYSTDPLGIEF